MGNTFNIRFSRLSPLHVAVLVAILASLLFIDGYFLVVLWLSLLLVALTEGMKLTLWSKNNRTSKLKEYTGRPKVSVHLAICSEPPEIVLATIRAVVSQTYFDFELIVVDNNTKDEKLWRPVEEYCESLKNVRFFHLPNWPFYKSGALNFARKVTHQKSEFIFVLDADYVLEPNALELAVLNIENELTGLVQFPQAYVCKKPKHAAIIEEFNLFFEYYCCKADSCRGVLATGTLSLIRIAALDEVGGWPINSITEDAELGSRLQSGGYNINYVNQIIGKGVVPVQQESFIKQRKRWIFGNVQTLSNYTIKPWQNFEKWLSGVSQLTAWINFLGLPILVLVGLLMLGPWLDTSVFANYAAIAYSAYWIFTLSKFIQLQLVQNPKRWEAFQTFLIHFSSLDIGAFHWWPVLLGKERPFIRTDKSSKKADYRYNLLYPLLHFGLFVTAIGFDAKFVASSALAFALLHIMSAWFDYSCRSSDGSSLSFDLALTL